ncbi:MAG TPA: ATP phosphoribosyltransferase regulatory subunit [Plasticicumulans sp.]|uniref:ATP phosphoribosyltransferase regulatory subunit n=1 Tax=Plasticicumulans sp. TaxID=2307179 RepID=UPI000FC1A5FF|nr:ATP phosphoribosyltransferase regulatory subunit [Plasticicumulans sp.]MBS0602786.1 ATP phosphoribosyltransferase regulatory subunit [Pseudomonadota bacterium]RTL00891.1 MAG: ATP phosphoribosyltransferase regulatory subunit [Xanthomonadales bacterium]HMW28502.1 ATP phosphoribosyltransferase regulatory subunit [Plasticicumulans sp.]HMW41313.1 ATP phosphoribosyltransferase regulatory subunit [Plasticicumulans sp.]HMZ09459.1 ATP phosphoribosyltransferase regulatory subunit [Plasticicumulans sp
MTVKYRWLLPEGIEEILPAGARRVERLRRDLLDLYGRWGYELVMPPFIEFLDALLTGFGRDLELETFKLTDQLSGRLLGVRADMTPQVARIDAHQLARAQPNRLCYLGTVLRTRGDGFGGSRSPLQIGAELYGHAGPESDIEIIALMLETLRLARVEGVHLDLGHVGLFRALARHAGLDERAEGELFDMLQRKSVPDIRAWLDETGLDAAHGEHFLRLASLNGGIEVLDAAGTALAGLGPEVGAALDALRRTAAVIARRYPGLPIHVDLAELRGYHYHTGLVFAAYLPQFGSEVARGGRYDGIGSAFGRSRPATGFSADLKALLELGEGELPAVAAIWAPAEDDAALEARIAALRNAGERVIHALPGAEDGGPRALGCDRVLVRRGSDWHIEDIGPVAG